MSLPVMLIFLVLALCGDGVQSQVPPAGYMIRVSQRACDLAAKLASALFFEEAQKNQIADQIGSKSLLVGDVNYEITNVQVTNAVKPQSNVVLRPGVIVLTLTNASIAVAGSWSYNYRWWLIDTSDSGSFKGSVNNASITLFITLGLDASGHPTVSTAGCNRSISSVSFELKGGSSWKNNLFKEYVKGSIQDQICAFASRLINVRANNLLASLPVQTTVANDFVFDNRLVSAPQIQNGFVDIRHKATVYYKGDNSEPPIQAYPFPTPMTSSDKMLTLFISDYVPNTVGYAVYRRNTLRYNITYRSLPDAFNSCLNTSCSGPCCVGNVFPQLASQYPKASVEVELVANKAPTTNISSSGIVATFSGVATFRARLSAGSLVEILKINVTLNVFVTVTLNSTGLKYNVTKIVPSVTILKSAVGSISADALNKTIDLLGKMIVIPEMNDRSRDGIQFPLPVNVSFKDVAMEMQDHYLRFTTNVDPKP